MKDEEDHIAWGYAVGTLNDDERAQAEELLVSNQQFREQVRDYQDDLDAVFEAEKPMTPSDSTRDAILALPQQHPQNDAAEASTGTAAMAPPPEESQTRSPRSTRRRRLPTTMFALAASAVLLLAAVVMAAVTVNQTQERNELAQQLAAEQEYNQEVQQLLAALDLNTQQVPVDNGGTLDVKYSASLQMFYVTPHDMPELPEDQIVQMWIADDDGLTSPGTMDVNGSRLVESTVAGEATLMFTVEPQGGSEEPTGEIFAQAEL